MYQQPYGAPPGGGYPGQTPPQQQPYGYPGQAPHQSYGAPAGAYANQYPPQQAYAYHGQPQQQPPYGAAQQFGYQDQGPQQQPYASAPPTTGAYSANYPNQSYGAGPPPGVSWNVWNWFKAVDQDNSGQISCLELQQALTNGNWTPFNAETCRLMIGMFDQDKSGTIGINEFSALWKYITDWKACFESFDRDRSGTIDVNELQSAFRTFGYNLSIGFCQLCITRFDKNGRQRAIKFDDFIQCCVMLYTLTEAFKAKDHARTGVIDLKYEDFLGMVIDTTLPK